jgi:hypothetical protein
MVEDGKVDELSVELRRGFEFKGKLVAPDGVGLHGLQILYELSAGQQAGNPTQTVRMGWHRTRVDGDGTWTVAGLARHSNLTVQLVLPPALTAALTKGLPDVLATRRLPLPIRRLYPLEDDVESTFDLRELRAVDVSFAFADGHATAHAEVRLLPPSDRIVLNALELVHSDRRGRCRVFATDEGALLAAHTKTHYAFARVGKRDRQTVTLTPCARFAGRVVDKNGKPVSGAAVALSSIKGQGSQPWLRDSERDYRWAWTQSSFHGTTDENGRFLLTWIPTRGMILGVRASVNNGRVQVNSAETVLRMESVENAVLTLDVDGNALEKDK